MTYNAQGIGKSGARKRLVEDVVLVVDALDKNGAGWYSGLIAIIEAVNRYKKEISK